MEAARKADLYTLDVGVWLDNLGVELDDPDDPHYRFGVNVLGLQWIVTLGRTGLKWIEFAYYIGTTETVVRKSTDYEV